MPVRIGTGIPGEGVRTCAGARTPRVAGQTDIRTVLRPLFARWHPIKSVVCRNDLPDSREPLSL